MLFWSVWLSQTVYHGLMIEDRQTQVNRGYRIQMNSAIGPYRRTSFSPICKFKYFEILAFEQTLKTA
jgi:glutamate dehydrogenase (NADP+)